MLPRRCRAVGVWRHARFESTRRADSRCAGLVEAARTVFAAPVAGHPATRCRGSHRKGHRLQRLVVLPHPRRGRDPAGEPRRRGPTPKITLRAWGPGAEQAVDRGLHLLGAYDDWSAFDAPAASGLLHPVVARSRKFNPGLRLPSTGRVFDALLPAILEQKVTVIEANFAWRYLCRAVGEIPPEPAPEGMRLPPVPAAVRSLQPWQWHQARVDARRSATAVRAAAAAGSLERWALLELGAKRENAMGAGTLAAATGFHSRGWPWTVAEVLQRTHGSRRPRFGGGFPCGGIRRPGAHRAAGLTMPGCLNCWRPSAGIASAWCA